MGATPARALMDEGRERWMGWERRLLEPLLIPDLNPVRLGEVLESLVSARLAERGRPNWRLYLYVRDEAADRYDLTGVWGAALPACTVPTLGNSLDAAQAEAHAVLAAAGESPGEVFLPLEAEEGVLGFVLFRPLVGCVALATSAEELSFLGRLGGAALSRYSRTLRGESAAQHALASATRYLERMLALTNDAILLVDPEAQILAVNEAAELMLQQYAIDLVGRPLEAALPPEVSVAFMSGITLAARQEVPVVRTLRLAPPRAGAPREVEANFERIQVDPEAPPGILICLRDLEAIAQQDWYRRSESRRDRTLAVLTHSLLRPVAALRGYLWVLRDELGEEPRHHELFSALDLQAEWLQSRLDTVALIDQFRAKSVLWRDQAVSVGTLLDRAMIRVRSRLFARGARLESPEIDLDERLWVDVDKWILALSALLDEVAHHLDGPGVISIEVRRTRAASGRLLLRMRGGRLPKLPLENELPYEEMAARVGLNEIRSPEGMTLARTVVHHYGGTLLWDWEEEGTAAVTLSVPLTDPIHAARGAGAR
ncbi:MAG: PAS domain-containing protein [Candidatus Eisenbacteria bacterium]|nr:PAS domain-containing protein [Candidatus Eisenbacteria bacterium]MCC7143602.1 PAS domain-containing protein [Candidatus Eisenbacteria bacterium]